MVRLAKKSLVVLLSSFFALLCFIPTTSFAKEIVPYAPANPDPNGDVTSSFSYTMKRNALDVAYYAQHDKTYPLGTGLYFAGKVKSRGVWDYKHAYGPTLPYRFGGLSVRGEDLGNIHYGYVGRAAKFSAKLLKSAAGAVQIYSGTAHVKWYKTYFDDPRDQTYIAKGISYWDKRNLPTKASSRSLSIENTQNFPEVTLTEEEKKSIIEEAEKNAELIMNDPAYKELAKEALADIVSNIE